MNLSYSSVRTVQWGESDPFGLVYYPRMTEWFNDTEHEMFRALDLAIDDMINQDRTTFVMGEIQFRFVGPAAYGDQVRTTITLDRLGSKTLHWNCAISQAASNAPIANGSATRVYAHIAEDGSLSSRLIPEAMRARMTDASIIESLAESLSA